MTIQYEYLIEDEGMHNESYWGKVLEKYFKELL